MFSPDKTNPMVVALLALLRSQGVGTGQGLSTPPSPQTLPGYPGQGQVGVAGGGHYTADALPGSATGQSHRAAAATAALQANAARYFSRL